jgi:hypothetical protein
MDLSDYKPIDELHQYIYRFITLDELKELVSQNKAPHLIIKNPLTGEEKIYCSVSELSTWLFMNHIVHIESTDLSTLKPAQILGIELTAIQPMYHVPIEWFQAMKGIYFLFENNELKYIGESDVVLNRLATHLGEKKKIFNKIYFHPFPYSSKLRKAVEISLIRYFKPEYNVQDTVNFSVTNTQKTLLNKFFNNEDLSEYETFDTLGFLCKNDSPIN